MVKVLVKKVPKNYVPDEKEAELIGTLMERGYLVVLDHQEDSKAHEQKH